MGYANKVLPLRKQAEIRLKWLGDRLDKILPDLMKEAGIDMWVVFSQENNEDPVMKTLLPPPMWGSRRRTMLMFFLREDNTVERISISRPDVGMDKLYNSVWLNQADSDWARFAALSPSVPNVQYEGPKETQVECAKRFIDKLAPKKIGLNYTQNEAYGDGISHGMFTWFAEGVGEENAAKIVSASGLCTRWLEARLPEEIEAMTGIVLLTEEVLSEALSQNVIHPGITTASDLSWWVRQRCEDLNLDPWFHPSATLKRHGGTSRSGDTVIQGGDVICIDMGIDYLGFCTDIKGTAYVLKRGEKEPPAGIQALFEHGIRVENIIAEEIAVGRTGNEILASCLDRAESEGIRAMIYNHPIGVYGHGAGPTMGLVDNQTFVKFRGENNVYDNTCFSMEFNVSANIPEWGGELLTHNVETDVAFTGGKVEFFRRQEKLYLV